MMDASRTRTIFNDGRNAYGVGFDQYNFNTKIGTMIGSTMFSTKCQRTYTSIVHTYIHAYIPPGNKLHCIYTITRTIVSKVSCLSSDSNIKAGLSCVGDGPHGSYLTCGVVHARTHARPAPTRCVTPAVEINARGPPEWNASKKIMIPTSSTCTVPSSTPKIFRKRSTRRMTKKQNLHAHAP